MMVGVRHRTGHPGPHLIRQLTRREQQERQHRPVHQHGVPVPLLGHLGRRDPQLAPRPRGLVDLVPAEPPAVGQPEPPVGGHQDLLVGDGRPAEHPLVGLERRLESGRDRGTSPKEVHSPPAACSRRARACCSSEKSSPARARYSSLCATGLTRWTLDFSSRIRVVTEPTCSRARVICTYRGSTAPSTCSGSTDSSEISALPPRSSQLSRTFSIHTTPPEEAEDAPPAAAIAARTAR